MAPSSARAAYLHAPRVASGPAGDSVALSQKGRLARLRAHREDSGRTPLAALPIPQGSGVGSRQSWPDPVGLGDDNREPPKIRRNAGQKVAPPRNAVLLECCQPLNVNEPSWCASMNRARGDAPLPRHCPAPKAWIAIPHTSRSKSASESRRTQRARASTPPSVVTTSAPAAVT